jgi:dethiobiotin synthetase
MLRFCNRVGIEDRSIGPIVFYKGFTRAFLNGETDSSTVLLQKARDAVDEVSLDKKFVLIDGVGYPSVGSICGLSNAAVAKAVHSPVLLVGKSGVGDAVDSYNLNSSYFESQGIPVLGAIFNKLELEGFYGLESCKSAISSYFRQFRHGHEAYGFMPKIDVSQDENGFLTVDEYQFLQSEIELSDNFMKYVNVYKLLTDIWRKNVRVISCLYFVLAA